MITSLRAFSFLGGFITSGGEPHLTALVTAYPWSAPKNSSEWLFRVVEGIS
jgi:hypothetical protein